MEKCKCGHKQSKHRTNEDGNTFECYFDSGDAICCCRKYEPTPVAQEPADRIKLTTKGGQSIPSLKGVSRLNLDLIEAEANRQHLGKQAEDKKEIERLEQLLKDAAKKITMQYDEYKTMRSNFKARLASTPTKEEAKAVLDLSWCSGCEGRLRPKDAPVDAECSDICPLNSLLPKLKAIVSQTDKEVKP